MCLIGVEMRMVNYVLRVWLLGSILCFHQETNHAELMEHEASLSRNAQEEKLSLQQVIKAITQALVSLSSVTGQWSSSPTPPPSLSPLSHLELD